MALTLNIKSFMLASQKAKNDTLTAQTVTETARDVTLAAKNQTEVFRDETEAFKGQAQAAAANVNSYGLKAQRPLNPQTAAMFFLIDEKKRIEFNGSRWQYLDGSLVDLLTITDGNIYSASASYTTQTLAENAETTYQNGVDMTKDLIFYTNLKLADSDDYFNMFFSTTTTAQFQVSFGYNWSTSVKDGATISIHDLINSANSVLGSTDLYTAAHDVVVWYDHKWGYVNVYVDAVLIGSWKPSAGANINSVTRIYGKAGSTSTLVTLNSYYMGIPLVTAIGDSITAGAILHAPNPDHYAGVDNYGNNYPKLISDYLKTEGIKNYFVVNKGVNGETSDQIKARFAADIVATGCKYVFIHGGINDHDTHADTAITTQNKIDMAYSALEASITPTLLGVTPTKTGAPGISHQYSIDLHAAEQTAYTNYNYVDLWTAIQGSTANAADDAKMADTVHPNLTGYTAIAIEIENNLT